MGAEMKEEKYSKPKRRKGSEPPGGWDPHGYDLRHGYRLAMDDEDLWEGDLYG